MQLLAFAYVWVKEKGPSPFSMDVEDNPLFQVLYM